MIPEYLDVPIFPLPNVTFFPKTTTPFHIFEPRYCEMIESTLAGDRLLGVALLREGWQKDYFGRPPVHKVFGVGKIIDYEELIDGGYNIVVEGRYRVRLVTEHETPAFRTGRVMVLQDGPIDQARDEVRELAKEMREGCARLGDLLPDYRELLNNALALHPHPGVTSDQLAATLVVDAYDRQSILEETDPVRRMKRVLVQIRLVEAELGEKSIQEEVLEED